MDPDDVAVVTEQLGRPPRSIHAVGHRCPCGNPDVVATEPRLDDGTPFPTTFYLTCPRAASMIGTLEASGLMREMNERLAEDADLASSYAAAHDAYLAARAEIGEVPEIAGVSAGGMPDRVKCLHVLAGQALAQGRGTNPLGDEVLDRLGAWWEKGPCVVSTDPADGDGS
ncbi:septum formation initiator family protein [Marmoricola sp. Leaf446]|nr:septum formation initiator family protein [Marmoricola sp. Leaf446]